MLKIIRRSLVSLSVGGLFGLALGTSLPDAHALVGSAAATAFMYGGLVYNARIEQREADAVREEEADV
ncbi:MAG: hypothetical protein ACJ798_11900 [Phenylobacterium sp.]